MANEKNRATTFKSLKSTTAAISIIILLIALISYYFLNKSLLSQTVYRTAIDETWSPLQLYDKEEDVTIFSKEILQTIATNQHFSIDLLQVETDILFPELDNGEYDAVLSSLLVLENNNIENYIYSNPYYLLGPVLIVSKSSIIKSLNDLNGKTIGILAGSEQIRSLYAQHHINFVIYDFNNNSQLIDDVSNNVIDGIILNMMPAYEYTKSSFYRDFLKIITPPLTSEGLRLIAKDNPESKVLIDKFNEGLKSIKKNGIYSQLLLK